MTDTPYEYGEWHEDYHRCVGENTCEVIGGLCPLDPSRPESFNAVRAAAAAGRFKRPRDRCEACGTVIGLAEKA